MPVWCWASVSDAGPALNRHWFTGYDTGISAAVNAALVYSSRRVVFSEAVDWCISSTRKIQHAGDWEPSRPQGLKDVHSFLMTVRPVSWACGNVTAMFLLLKNYFRPDCPRGSLRYDRPKKCLTILYRVNLWLKPVSATGAATLLASLCGGLAWVSHVLRRMSHTHSVTHVLPSDVRWRETYLIRYVSATITGHIF